MWLFTRAGFFSVVEKDKKGFLTVRARVLEDLQVFIKTYLSGKEKIERRGSDYPYRIVVKKEVIAEAIKKIVLDVDYTNFKDMVLREQGLDREQVYMRIWSDMARYGDDVSPAKDRYRFP
jgi:hypothetical protein